MSRATILILAKACGLTTAGLASLLGPNDRLTEQAIRADDLLSQLLDGKIERVTVLPDGSHVTCAPLPRGVLAGSFDPLHAGHIGLARVAAEILGGPVAFEISVLNVDKPPLGPDAARGRLLPFAWHGTMELTRAPTFLEKSRVLPGVTFVVGADTAERIIEPKYYAESVTKLLAALHEIADRGCHFLVAGRRDATGRFQTLADIRIPQQFANLFTAIPESRFRLDLSSTDLRVAAGNNPFSSTSR